MGVTTSARSRLFMFMFMFPVSASILTYFWPLVKQISTHLTAVVAISSS